MVHKRHKANIGRLRVKGTVFIAGYQWQIQEFLKGGGSGSPKRQAHRNFQTDKQRKKGPQKGRSIGIFKLKSKKQQQKEEKTLRGWGFKLTPPPQPTHLPTLLLYRGMTSMEVKGVKS